MHNNQQHITSEECTQSLRAVRDALDVLHGMWKLQILISLSEGPKRFRQIAKEVAGISDKMLSKELKELEQNQLVKRTVHDTFPPTVEYSRTEHAKSLGNVLHELRSWGMLHRKKIIGK